MKKLFTYIAVFTSLLLMHPAFGYSAVKWLADIRVTYGDDSNRLLLGADNRATDGFDNGFEIRAILGGYVQAYFEHPEWNKETSYFWSDIRYINLPKEWVFYAASYYVNSQMRLSWELTDVPPTVDVFLTDDATGSTIDMKLKSSYIYTNTASVARVFRVNATGYLEGGAVADGTAPDTAIIAAPSEFINTASIAIAYTGADDTTPPGDMEFSYKVDSGPWSAWSASQSATLSDLSDGAHTFSVKAKDEAGNEDPTPAEARFTVDTAAPMLILNQPAPAILWPPNGKMVNVTISGNASDAGSGLDTVSYIMIDEYGEFAYSGDIQTSKNGDLSFTLSLKAERTGSDRDGRTYSVTVTALDKAGNTAVQSAAISVPHDQR